jgi:hypothetical protein
MQRQKINQPVAYKMQQRAVKKIVYWKDQVAGGKITLKL